MSKPITRTILPHPAAYGGRRQDKWIKQVSVRWCKTHKSPMWPSGDLCSYIALSGATDLGNCKLLDPHAPDAVWRDTE